MKKAYVAVDLGASSGRVMIGKLNNGIISLEEAYRFRNGFVRENGHDRWKIDDLVNNVLTGLHKVKEMGYDEMSVGIDTWGVDYVLVDGDGKKLCDPVCYRDSRTDGMIEKVTEKIPPEYIYEKTGIQFGTINTLYQLCAEDKELLEKTKYILFTPDYIGYVLTGIPSTETTIASTSQMLELDSGRFNKRLLDDIGIQEDKFAKLVSPGTYLGPVKDELIKEYDLPKGSVFSVAGHDTASAVLGAPAIGKHWAFLSSGTWSLLGMEMTDPINSETAYKNNFTNEWGYNGTYTLLRNIMGTWLTSRVHRELGEEYNVHVLDGLALKVEPFQQFININDERFQNPDSMISELRKYCSETGQTVPETPGELAMAIYSNLSLYYAEQIRGLNEITGTAVDSLDIVGGGSNADIINRMTCDVSGLNVYAGPSEATAIGNIVVQMIENGDILNQHIARKMIVGSFDVRKYEPEKNKYAEVYDKYRKFMSSIERR